MVELVNTFPAVNVEPAEYKRLLGYPPDRVLEGRAAELAVRAREWYRLNGRPWVYARQIEQLEIGEQALSLEGSDFHCRELLRNLQDAEANGVIVAAVSAGPELEAAAQQAWKEEKPDEYFFLEVYGSAVVEHLVTMAGAQFCAWAEGNRLAVLPHYSPGYGEWDVAEQPRLLDVIHRPIERSLPGPLDVLESGMLCPKKSMLAVFGLTAEIERAKDRIALVPCERCSFQSCQFRRGPYQGADVFQNRELAAVSGLITSLTTLNGAEAGNESLQYRISRKALHRWANERLTITPGEDGTIDVVFKHEGTTCSNMGRPLLFDYHLRLASRNDGFRILEQDCKPNANDVGHQAMCGYLDDPVQMMAAIDRERPLLGRTLADVLDWQRPSTTASCYCETISRQYMWGQVLETIHYALHKN
jgi:hypothetical protein